MRCGSGAPGRGARLLAVAADAWSAEECGFLAGVVTRPDARGRGLGEDPVVARAAFEACVAEVCARDAWLTDHPVRVTWPGGQFASGWLPAGRRLLSLVQTAHADATDAPAPRERGATYGSDLRLYAGAGIPALQYGPGDIGVAHSAREVVSVRESVGVARALALVVVPELGTA